MDLIYADVVNGMAIDRGVLSNYTFDLSFGADENDFQLVIPMSGTRLNEDQIVYIPGTEYGGIIDSIKVDTAEQMLTYTGRTWHGILENKILYPEPGDDYFYVCGEANAVLGQLLERMNIVPGNLNELYVHPDNSIITASEEDSGIYVEGKITSESGNYAHGYSFIRDLLYTSDAKPVIIDGILSAKNLMDYSNSDDFLEGTDQFQAQHNYNALNRLHCLGAGELRNRYTIDLYLTENGVLLPYSRENPIQDSDYYTDINALASSTNPEDVANFAEISQNMVTGSKEIADIYDYPNAQLTYHYVPQTSKPSDWEADFTPEITDVTSKDKRYGFQKYFYQDDEEAAFKEIEKPDIDYNYNLQYAKPKDWESDFANYYRSNANGYEKVASVTAYDPVGTMPGDWYTGGYSNYYKLSGSSYTKVTLVSGLVHLDNEPEDWQTSWGNYCYADGSKVEGVHHPDQITEIKKPTAPKDWATEYSKYYIWDGLNYVKVQGKSVIKYKKLKSKPSDWNTSYTKYFIKVKGEWVHVTKKSQWDKDKVRQQYTKTVAPDYNAKTTYYLIAKVPDTAPAFPGGQYYTGGKVVPTWGDFTVYKKRTIPTWTENTFYTKEPYQPIPAWNNTICTQYEDHYQALVEGALKKIEDNVITNELSIKLDELTTYDINDRVGASDEVTGIGAVERIIQKVVRIQRGIVSFDYSTGK